MNLNLNNMHISILEENLGKACYYRRDGKYSKK